MTLLLSIDSRADEDHAFVRRYACSPGHRPVKTHEAGVRKGIALAASVTLLRNDPPASCIVPYSYETAVAKQRAAREAAA
jgi:hypothetical protein